MTDGTYTVTATDSKTEDTDSADFEVTKQHVDSIVILNETALTNRDANINKAHKEAYAYYDVLDQYGQSMRASTSIQWSGSAKITADKANGKLTMKKNNEEAWVFNDKIYITGVYVKTGVSASATLTVGTEQSLDSIEQVGFLKKGTTEIIQDLPADFKSQEYYLLFHALDQNGCPLKAGTIDKEDVTFVSDNVLVVKELTTFAPNALTVEGVEYDGIFVEPGIKVADGGEVTVTAIANKTGNKTDLNFMVGEDRVVVSFTLGAPAGIVADGDTDVVIPYEAIDEKGEKLTNFRALAKQEIFNTLSFNTSEGTLALAEQNDGTAKLTWTDSAAYIVGDLTKGTSPWANSNTTDGIDRPISLSVVVVGGEPDNEMIYVQDKRRPNAVSDVNMDEVYVEGASIPFTLNNTAKVADFKFIDQYETVIGSDWGADNGFFAAAADGELQGIDFKDYHFGIRIENAGAGKVVLDGDNSSPLYLTDDEKKAIIEYDETAAYKTTTDIQSTATGEGFKFEIVKFKAADDISINKPEDWEAVSPSKFKGLTVVDITQVKNFKVGDLNTFYTGKLDATGDGIIASGMINNLKDETYVTPVTSTVVAGQKGIYSADDGYRQEVKVTGTYNGKDVSIPGEYFTITTTKDSLRDTNNDDKFDRIGTIYLSNLYDKTTANGNAKLGEDEVVATISKVYDNRGFWTWSAEKGIYTDDTITATDANIALEAGRLTVMSDAANALLSPADATTTTTIKALADAANLAGAKTALTNGQTTYTNAQTATTNAAKALALVGLSDEQWTEYNTLEAKVTATTIAADLNDATKFTYTTLVAADGSLAAAKKALLARANVLATLATVTAFNLAGDELTDFNQLVEDVYADPAAFLAPATPDYATTYTNITDGTAPGTIDHQTDVTAYAQALAAYLDAIDDMDGLDSNEQALIDAEEAKIDADPTYAIPNPILGLNTAENTAAQTYLTAYKAEVVAANALPALEDAVELQTAYEAAHKADLDITDKQAQNTAGTVAHGEVYDTAKAAIKYSDQKPYAADIKGLKDSYVFNPYGTEINVFYDATQDQGVYLKSLGGNLTVVDQYGVVITDAVLDYTVSNAVESKDGYADNNFKVSNNGGAAPTIEGAEINDTFDLVVSVHGSTIKATTKVTVGADGMASIVNSVNNYTRDGGLKAILEEQRLAGLQ